MYLIAELGINHNGSLEIARQMILSAAQAGFDAVKFQMREPEIVYTKEFLDSPRESPWGKTQRDQKRGLEFSLAQYEELHRYCASLGIAWSASCWDLDSTIVLESFSPPFHKIASPMLGHKPLLRCIANFGRKTFISTGMSTLLELDEVVEIFRKADCPIELMHCNSTYPMPESEANLRCIPMLRERYECDVGYSGHETSLIKVCVAAAALGATSIERHITVDRAAYGSDQAASIECAHLHEFVASIRAVPEILGTGKKEITPSEWAARLKLRKDVE